MSSTINVMFTSKVVVDETFLGADPAASLARFDPLNESIVFNASSSPAATKHSEFNQALTTGAATIDLTALPGITVDETVNGTGLSVVLLKLLNPAANANKIAASQGASNAYRLDGATSWSVALAPGQSVTLQLNGVGDVIGSGHKNIDLAGTGSQALSVQVVMG